MHDNWGIDHPYKFQIHAIHPTAFQRNEMLYIIAKTGLGKSVIPLLVGTLQTGVVITLVPLIGLGIGSNQVTNSCSVVSCVEAYHVNEHRGKDAAKLRHRLDFMTEREAYSCVSKGKFVVDIW